MVRPRVAREVPGANPLPDAHAALDTAVLAAFAEVWCDNSTLLAF